jgi:hypothetical protein
MLVGQRVCVCVAMTLVCAHVFACWILRCFGLSRLPRPVLPAGGGHSIRRWVGAGWRPLALRVRRLQVTQARAGPPLVTKSRMSSRPLAAKARVGPPWVHSVRRWVGAKCRPLATRVCRLQVTQARVGRPPVTRSRMSSQPLATQTRVARLFRMLGRPLAAT